MEIGSTIATALLLWVGVPKVMCPVLGIQLAKITQEAMWTYSPSMTVRLAMMLRRI